MKAAILCFSLTGYETGRRLMTGLQEMGWQAALDAKSKYLPESITISHQAWTEQKFREADAVIFVGACGIAVRSIAPFVKSKKTDTAVLVIDECGKFVISLLSGHLGGANELAVRAGEILEAQPVVTTATDLHGRFAVDVFSRKNGCSIFHMKAAKGVSAALLAGRQVGFYSEFPYEGELPEGLVLCDIQEESKPEIGIAVTVYRNVLPFASTVQIVPRVVTMGIGCKKDKEPQAVLETASESLKTSGIYREAISALASVDLKKEEPALLALSEKWQVPFETYSGEELRAVSGEFTPSDFVKKVTGVDNVCERSAVLASGHGHLIQNKTCGCGVTTAMAVRDWRICFE